MKKHVICAVINMTRIVLLRRLGAPFSMVCRFNHEPFHNALHRFACVTSAPHRSERPTSIRESVLLDTTAKALEMDIINLVHRKTARRSWTLNMTHLPTTTTVAKMAHTTPSAPGRAKESVLSNYTAWVLLFEPIPSACCSAFGRKPDVDRGHIKETVGGAASWRCGQERNG